MPSPTQLKRKFIIKVSVLFTSNPESLIPEIHTPFLSSIQLSLSLSFTCLSTILSRNFQRALRLTDELFRTNIASTINPAPVVTLSL